MAKLAENVYGDALFSLSKEEGKIDEFSSQAEAILLAVKENPAFLDMMDHPNIGKEEKLSTIDDIFKGRIDDSIIGLLRVMVEKDRFNEIERVLNYFLARVKEEKKIGVVKVTTPMPLSDEKKKEIEKKLLETTDYVSFETEYSIDPDLLGGMVLRIGDRVVDSSVRTKLMTLKKELR